MTPELMGAAVLALVEASPSILRLIIDLLDKIKGVDEQRATDLVERISLAIQSLNAAQTQTDRQNALKEIADAIHSLA